MPVTKAPEWLTDSLNLSHVPRWTTHPVSRQQYVDGHSYRVAVIAMAIWELLPWEVVGRGESLVQLKILRWALLHDAPEAKLGDWPEPSKAVIGHLDVTRTERAACPWIVAEEPNGVVKEIVKIADCIEALSWISTYGSGMKDRFSGERVVSKITRKIWDMTGVSAVPGITEAVTIIMREVASVG